MAVRRGEGRGKAIDGWGDDPHDDLDDDLEDELEAAWLSHLEWAAEHIDEATWRGAVEGILTQLPRGVR